MKYLTIATVVTLITVCLAFDTRKGGSGRTASMRNYGRSSDDKSGGNSRAKEQSTGGESRGHGYGNSFMNSNRIPEIQKMLAITNSKGWTPSDKKTSMASSRDNKYHRPNVMNTFSSRTSANLFDSQQESDQSLDGYGSIGGKGATPVNRYSSRSSNSLNFQGYENSNNMNSYEQHSTGQDSSEVGIGASHRQPIKAAVQTKHTFEELPVDIQIEEMKPQIIEIEGNAPPVEIVFKSFSSRVKVKQSHKSQAPSEVKMTHSEDEPHRLVHTVRRPIIQEVREIITPIRMVMQQIEPVQEQILTIISKKEERQGSVEARRDNRKNNGSAKEGYGEQISQVSGENEIEPQFGSRMPSFSGAGHTSASMPSSGFNFGSMQLKSYNDRLWSSVKGNNNSSLAKTNNYATSKTAQSHEATSITTRGY